MTIANKLTLLRLLLIPLFIGLLIINNFYTTALALLIFIIQIITDVLDGKLARKKNQVTPTGKLIDPLVDKILVISAFVLFIDKGIVWAWIVILIIMREFIVSGLRLILKDIQLIEASFLGKCKTITQMLGVCFIIIILLLKTSYKTQIFDLSIHIIMLVVLFITIVSGIDYFIKNKAFIDYL